MMLLMPIDSGVGRCDYKKGRNLSIKREPLDGAYSNRHPAYMRDTTNGVETYQTGLSICSKNCPDFLVKMNYLSAPGIFPPGSTTKIGNYS